MAAFENTEVTEEDIAAVLERDGLIANAGLFRDERGNGRIASFAASVREALTVD